MARIVISKLLRYDGLQIDFTPLFCISNRKNIYCYFLLMDTGRGIPAKICHPNALPATIGASRLLPLSRDYQTSKADS